MGRRGVSGAAGRDHQEALEGPGGRHVRGKRRAKRPPGLAIIERGGYWHLVGTVRIKGRSIRIRESTGLPAKAETKEAAQELRRQKEQQIRDQVLWGTHSSVAVSVAVEAYLTRPRKRPLNAIDGARLKEIDRRFGPRQLNRIAESEWLQFVDQRMKGRAAVTRERYIDLVMSFLTWCEKRPRCWVGQLPAFDRVREARQKRERRARRVGDLRPELIALLMEHAAPHLKGQMALMWSTGGRVSSLLYDCRVCDYLAAEGREQVTFHDTKNGYRVTAAIHPWAAAVMREYLAWRGHLEDREAALFLTDRREPYADNGKAAGGQTKTAFRAMVRRTCVELRRRALTEAMRLRRAGQAASARAHWSQVCSDIQLLLQLTPHWFRHLLATNLLASGDLRSAMEQGGWLDARSILGYSHDVPSRRRALVGALPAPGAADTFLTRASSMAREKH